MVLLHDGPSYPEPHDCVMVERSLNQPREDDAAQRPRFEMYDAWAREDGSTCSPTTASLRKSDTSSAST